MEEVGAAPPPASFRPPQQLHLKQQQQRGSGKRCFLSGSSHLSSTMKLNCANLSSRSPPAASMGLVVAPDCGGLDVASPAPPFLSRSTEQPFGPKTQQMHVSPLRTFLLHRLPEGLRKLQLGSPGGDVSGAQVARVEHAQEEFLLLRWSSGITTATRSA